MLICRNCGAQLPDGVPFCTACGAPQQYAAAPQYGGAQPQTAAQSARSGYEAWKQQQAAPCGGQQSYVPQQADQHPWGGYAAQQELPQQFDWTRLQPRMRPAGASGLIAAITLLLLAAAMLIWGMTV